MRKILGFLFLSMAIVVLNGCILSASPSTPAVTVQVGKAQPFGIKTLTTPTSVVWKLDGVVISGANTRYYTYTPEAADVGDHNLSVTKTSKLFGTDTRSWVIHVVNAPVPIEITTLEQAENLLYTAYAGIGYMRADNIIDDEPLYNAMLDDLNGVAGDFVLNTIFGDNDVVNKLLGVLLGQTKTFYWNVSPLPGASSAVTVNPGSTVNGYRSFSAYLQINFNDTGYTWETCQYYGPDGGYDLTANVSGYLKASTSGLEELWLRTVTIQAQKSLKAVYPTLGEVTYGDSSGATWKIEYTLWYGPDDPTNTASAPMNVKLLPVIVTEPTTDVDSRDYKLSGTFALGGNKYLFPAPGMRYRQWQYDERTLIALNGGLVPPGLTSAITLSSPDDTVNPLASGTIVRSLAGIWTSGIMYISGISSASQVVFNSNGSCLFSGGDQGDWTVLSWQNTLEP